MQKKLETRIGVFVLAAIALFFYMSFQIGSLRFNRSSYNIYLVSFKDISGISHKSLVKIAGVEAGWVEKIDLVNSGVRQVKAEVAIRKEYILTTDAYAVVRQDGVLGPYYLEIMPGDPLLPPLASGSELVRPGKESTQMDVILGKCSLIADNVEDVSASLCNVVGGVKGHQRMEDLIDNISETADHMAKLTKVVETSITRNEDNLDALLGIGNQVKRVSDQLDTKVLPSFQNNIERIASIFDRDFGKVAQDACCGLKNVNNVVDKIDRGEGFIGKLVNEDEAYEDLKYTVHGMREYLSKMDRMQIMFDAHAEYMFRPAENYGKHQDSKMYFDLYVQPSEDYFFLAQLMNTERGFVDRFQISKNYRDIDNCVIDTNTLDIDDATRLESVFTKETEVFRRYDFKIGLQIAKRFNNFTFRLGLFEGLGGVAVDCNIPFPTNQFRWITTFEAFDLRGWNRKDDLRPHLKWINRIFALDNLYINFGADDFVSRRNANLFFGLGLRFGDEAMNFGLSGLTKLAGGGASVTSDRIVEAVIIN